MTNLEPIKCPDCHEGVVPEANMCPECGYYFQKADYMRLGVNEEDYTGLKGLEPTKENYIKIIKFVAIAAVLIIVIFSFLK